MIMKVIDIVLGYKSHRLPNRYREDLNFELLMLLHLIQLLDQLRFHRLSTNNVDECLFSELYPHW